jgi:hypothetical protein
MFLVISISLCGVGHEKDNSPDLVPFQKVFLGWHGSFQENSPACQRPVEIAVGCQAHFTERRNIGGKPNSVFMLLL